MSLNLLKTYNTQFYQLLDWPLIIRDLSQFAHFDCTKDQLNSPPQAKSVEEIEVELDRVQYLTSQGEDSVVQIQHSISHLASDGHYMQTIEMLKKSKIATIPELHYIASLLEIFVIHRKQLADWTYFQSTQIEQRILQKLESHFIRPLRQFVDQNGNIDYFRHPLLRALYEELGSLERDLRQQISQLANHSTYSDALQFKEHDVINDRFVLAVRSDSYRTVLGPIVAKSSTGMTLFVEPPGLREKGNQRIHLLAKIEEITNRIARELSEVLHQYSAEVIAIKNLLIGTDLYLARARYIIGLDLQRPELSYDFEINLTGFFHPLIHHPVRNDLHLTQDNLGLIISGPNTGGKTVALKSIALCQLLLHCGLFLPVTSGKLMPVDGLFFFSSDQQNLEEGLSSFASETLSYLSIFDHFAHNNLIVIDEIFNSTSSDEASALAISFLEEVHQFSQSKVLISTHHQLFKTFIHSDSKYISAHVGHNQETFNPTYKIYTGEPGSSMAFHIFEGIAKRLKRITSIPKKAQSFLDRKQVSYDRLLQDLSSKKSELDRLLNENIQINRDLKNQMKAAEGLAHLEKQKIIEHYRSKLNKKLERAEDLIRQIKSKEIEGIRPVTKIAQQLTSELNSLDPKYMGHHSLDNVDHEELAASQIIVGARYYSTLLAKELVVESVNIRKNTINGICQKRQVQCPIASLRQLRNMPNAQKVKAPAEQFFFDRQVSGLIELDGRGMRLDQFQAIVEKSVFELLNGDIPFLTIIHGHGTGTLKSWLRQYLSTLDGLKFSPDDGNDGSTKVERKN